MMMKHQDQEQALAVDKDVESTSSWEEHQEEGDADQEQPQHEDEAALAKEETNAVKKTRCLVFFFLGLCIIGIALAVYFGVRHSETVKFQQTFEDHANLVLRSIGTSLDLTLAGFDALAVSLVSYTRAANQTWPLVTIPDFGTRASKIRDLSSAVYITMYPYVRDVDQRFEWEAWTPTVGSEWVNATMDLQERSGVFQDVLESNNLTKESITYFDVIHDNDQHYNGEIGRPHDTPPPFMPMWHTYPLLPFAPPYNWDLMASYDTSSIDHVFNSHKVSLSDLYLVSDPNDEERMAFDALYADWLQIYLEPDEEAWEPVSDFHYPILKDAPDYVNARQAGSNPDDDNLLGILAAGFYWRNLIRGIFNDDTTGVVVVFDNGCTQAFTYQINGQSAEYLGPGDLHDPDYEEMRSAGNLINLSRDFSVRHESSYTGVPVNEEFCPFEVRVYPSITMEQTVRTPLPALCAGLAALVFVVTSGFFLLHDLIQERRAKVVINNAIKSDKIVSSLFPSSVKNRLYDENAALEKSGDETGRGKLTTSSITRSQLGPIRPSRVWENSYKGESERAANTVVAGPPIADHFSDATILFADIAGFTAWSATREPSQVFELLETLFGAFDRHAKQSGVFKVETIGDCYLAVCGLPTPRRDHALVMVRFAVKCRDSTNELAGSLEARFGPGTRTLQLRSGLHSGPVTAGVLRGEKGRFQLFGDTVNTASRIESHGRPNLIHVSDSTARELMAAGKASWLTKREDLIEAKGKGRLQTFWVEHKHVVKNTFGSESGSQFSLSVSTSSDQGQLQDAQSSNLRGLPPLEGRLSSDTEKERLVDFVCAELEKLLRANIRGRSEAMPTVQLAMDRNRRNGETVRDQVSDALNFSACCRPPHATKAKGHQDRLPVAVTFELRRCISAIAHSYNCDTNAFHAWDHAVTVSCFANKMLDRLAARTPSASMGQEDLSNHSSHHQGGEEPPSLTAETCSDPLVYMALLFAALAHDSGHLGILPNQLVVENPAKASYYKNQSVAEQNSFDVAWGILSDPDYKNLQACMFASKDGVSSSTRMNLFRQLAVNAIMATDIFDPELKKWREDRWTAAFQEPTRNADLKMTVLLEYVMQASDLCHTMQHWSIYDHWNARLYNEMHAAFLAGRAGETDPSDRWFENELWFFDNQVLPLVEKLSKCRLFGNRFSRDLVDCAQNNRRQWEEHGRDIVQQRKKAVLQESSGVTFETSAKSFHISKDVLEDHDEKEVTT